MPALVHREVEFLNGQNLTRVLGAFVLHHRVAHGGVKDPRAGQNSDLLDGTVYDQGLCFDHALNAVL